MAGGPGGHLGAPRGQAGRRGGGHARGCGARGWHHGGRRLLPPPAVAERGVRSVVGGWVLCLGVRMPGLRSCIPLFAMGNTLFGRASPVCISRACVSCLLALDSARAAAGRVCGAAFVRAMLKGEAQPGVWFPEQREAVSDRRALLQVQPDPKSAAGARSHRVHSTGSCEVTWVKKDGPNEGFLISCHWHTGCAFGTCFCTLGQKR